MAYTTLGLGGGGSMFCPAVMPGNTSVMFVNCDMGGFYRSADGGLTWQMIDGHIVRADTRCQVAFHPDGVTAYMYGDSVYRGVSVSTDQGLTWTTLILPAQLPNGPSTLRALAIDPASPPIISSGNSQGGRIFVGTTSGAFNTTDNGLTWAQCVNVVGDVVGFLFLPNPTAPGTYLYFCATSEGVFQLAAGNTWQDISVGLPARPSPQYRVRSLAGGSLQAVKLYVTVPTIVTAGAWITGGVYYITDQILAAAGAWQPTPALPSKNAVGTYCAFDEYDFVSSATNEPETVYVTLCGSAPGGNQTVSGVFKTINGGATWTRVYNGYLSQGGNIIGGWADLDLDWGTTGAARFSDPNGYSGGLTICARNSNIGMYANTMILHTTQSGGVPTWQQGYTRQAAGQGVPASGQRWQSVQLEVTTTWNYNIDPHSWCVHYICYTDIGFARSSDGGTTWTWAPPVGPRQVANPRRYNSVYELAFDNAKPGRVWAAASNQHDIPYEESLVVRDGGGVSRSDDYGQSWVDFSGAYPGQGLPAAIDALAVPSITFADNRPGPVTSIVVDQISKRLWVSVFGSGVFSSDNASSLTSSSAGSVGWNDRSFNLPATNRNVYRVLLDSNGLPYCLVTAKRNVVAPSGASRGSQSTFTGETGLWRLTSLNGPWQLLTQSLANVWHITDFAVDPRNSQLIYITTSFVADGSNGTGSNLKVDGGVFRTVNGGGTWDEILCLQSQIPSQACEVLPRSYRDFVQAFKITLDSDNLNTLYVGTRTHGLWVSYNQGSTWSEFQPQLPFISMHRVTFGWQPRWFPWFCFWARPWPWWRQWLLWRFWPWWWRWPWCFFWRRQLYITSFGGGVFRVLRNFWECWPYFLRRGGSRANR